MAVAGLVAWRPAMPHTSRRMEQALATADLTRAWQGLVDDLVAAGTLKTRRIIEVFLETPRFVFVPPDLKSAAATADAPLPIGHGQTVSQPTTVAAMLELTQPRPGDRVLDVGTGSGWQAALLARCVGRQGRVVTIERVPALGEQASQTFRKLDLANILPLVGDANDGAVQHAPYQVIISAASSPDVPPAWVKQLAAGGRLLHPISGMGLRVMIKDPRGRTTARDYPGYVFVPLVYDEGKT